MKTASRSDNTKLLTIGPPTLLEQRFRRPHNAKTGRGEGRSENNSFSKEIAEEEHKGLIYFGKRRKIREMSVQRTTTCQLRDDPLEFR
jgi:hypothetical protein